MSRRRGFNENMEWEKKNCDRCGFAYYIDELRRQDGLDVCDMCYDSPSYEDRKHRKDS